MSKMLKYLLPIAIGFAFIGWKKVINAPVFSFKAEGETKVDLIYYDGRIVSRDGLNDTILQSIANYLNAHKDITIEVGVHSDCRGSDRFNLMQSTRRAETVAETLIEHYDVDSAQLLSKGYGETQPIDTCLCKSCNESQHRLNRRTVIKKI